RGPVRAGMRSKARSHALSICRAALGGSPRWIERSSRDGNGWYRVSVMDLLRAFWITGLDPHGPLGLGITAYHLDDALSLAEDAGYAVGSPDDRRRLSAIADVTPAQLPEHVARHMGPIVVRGIWYPFTRVGV